jgi:P27 family predicted phage terminase small subunit
MARPGRKPTPTPLRLLHGNPSRLPPPNNEPEGIGVLWAPPQWFDDEQRAQWHYAIEHAPPGLLTATDRETLVIWTVASVEHARAARTVSRYGQIVPSKDGTVVNPLLSALNKQALIMLRAGGEMGFSPSSRASLGRGIGPVQGRAGQIAGTPLAQYLAEQPDKREGE